MSSGEWDLRALKALEEEEQKEFLALSQKSLFEPPSPPGATTAASAGAIANSPQPSQTGLTYAQLHPHLLKLQLPTIDECNLQLVRQHASSSGGTGRLKFTRALSLSAHSLGARGTAAGGVSAGSGAKKYGKWTKFGISSKSIGSLSPTRHSASPVYTPPPIRRCATLHHTQPVRKTFKTLQQLEKQKKERKQEQYAASLRSHKSPLLQRVAGTNKTYWKYGANSTAASIIGQRGLLQRKRASVELESNTSDELGSEEAARPQSLHASAPLIDFDDSATDTGSCSVPLNTDSVEMMRLMLTAATSAVSAQPSATAGLSYLSAPPDIAATSGGSLLTLSSHANGSCAVKMSSSADDTVAYEAFQTLARRKSFSERRQQPGSNRTLLRGHSMAEEPHVAAVGNRKMLKSSSVDASTAAGGEYVVAAAGGGGGTMQRSSIITNPIVESIKATTATTTRKANHMCNSAKTTKTATISAASVLPPGMLLGSSLHFNEAHSSKPHQLSVRMGVTASSSSLCQQHQQDYGSNNSSSNSPAPAAAATHIIDDELEQHIKHCSCSCNHMGYGNSMDYQTTGFGGLPDVTEHSNIRRTLSRQNSISNSDSGGEIASIQKSKVSFGDTKAASAAAAIGATATTTSASAKRKSKAAQQSESGGAQRYKTRRGSCVLGLMLIVALALLAVAATLAYQHFLMTPSRNSHAQRLRIVRRILREVPLVDGHNNFAWNVRKYAHSSLELVHLGHEGHDHKTIWTRPVWAQTDMERLRQGLVGVQVWSAYVPCEAQGLDAVQLALEQIDIIRRLTDMHALQTTLVTSSKDIAAARRQGLMASLIGIEGGHAIGSSLGVLRSFYSLGARYLSLTHKCDVSWAGSSASPLENGLTQFGKAIIREMNRLGMMIDLSYSSDATARDVLQATRAPVIFSHSAARQLCNSTRNIPDDILRLVAENGGLIMISFDSEDVACGRQARLSDVSAHINYIRGIAGVQHIGLGAGYDGIDLPPVGLEDVSKYPDLLATLLEDHNWSEEDIAMLAGKNFLRIMETVENVRDYWKRAAIQPIEQTEPLPKTQCAYMSS